VAAARTSWRAARRRPIGRQRPLRSPVADGKIDTLNGGDGIDYCRVPFFAVETDIHISCENVDQD